MIGNRSLGIEGICLLAVLIGMGNIGALAAAAAKPQGSASDPQRESKAVTVSGRQILVNGAPYLIKGICYHPVPKGNVKRDFQGLEKDLALMTEAGVNTIRVYAPIDDSKVLDRIHGAGLKLVVGFGYNQDGDYDILSGSFVDYINKYKDHPAILMWELGNEYNYHPNWFEGDIRNWYTALNQAAVLACQHDPSRLVTTAHGELPDELALSSCPDIDVWGMNVYRWDDPGKIFDEWEDISNKPMYLSEAGADSFMVVSRDGFRKGVNEKAQAAAMKSILNSVFDNREVCSGVAVFSFTDGWWKAGNPDRQDPGGSAPNSGGVPYDGAANEEYWGIVDITRSKKAAFDVMKECYIKVQSNKGDSE